MRSSNGGFDRLVKKLVAFSSASHVRACALLVLLSALFFLPGFVSLQPMDRDEPRFAQASKQMLESHDFIDIRFQDDARYKKPVGIYWLQAASVAAGEALGVSDAARTIALYRIPSLFGAIAAVLLTYWTALAFLTQRNAFLSAALFSGCILIGVEARLAKTDAVLLATVLMVMGTLARLWLRNATPATLPPLPRATIMLFWIALGVSILIKGPITLMVALLAALVLSVKERSARWLLPLRPWLGLIIVVLIVLPWLAMIIAKTGTAFFSEAIGQDMLGKVGGGQERHGAPPGTYLGVFWATFWPAAPLAALAAPFAYRTRRDDAVAFLLAWIIPSWLVFEAVPTKLPHYVLPLYPAFAILILLAIQSNGIGMRKLWERVVACLVLLIPLALLVGLPTAFLMLDGRFPVACAVALFAGTASAALALRALWRGAFEPAIAASLAAAFALTIAAYPFGLPQLQSINLSRRLGDAAQNVGCTAASIATTGYREPSLVFLTRTDLVMTDGGGAAAGMALPGCRIAFIDQRSEAAFLAGIAGLAEKPSLVNRIAGFNINSGRRIDIGVYARR